MSSYASNTTAAAMARRINQARRILLTTHVKPDGDGLGAALALARAIAGRGAGQRADIHLMGPVERRLEIIAGATPYRMVEDDPPGEDYDLAVVLDTGAWSQLQAIAAWLRAHHAMVVGLDHHARGDEDVAALRIVDARAASTTQVLLPVLEAMGCKITGGPESVAEAIFVGLATDTGWFRFPGADAEALRLGARLLDLGVDKSRLYQVIEETFRPQRLSLAARALTSLRYAAGGAAAIMSLKPADFAATGGAIEDLSELVNTPMSVDSVRVSVLLAEHEPGRTKISLRSKPRRDAAGAAFVDVNLLAARFGGGGHVHAAGAVVRQPVEQAAQAIIAALEAPASAPARAR